MRRVALLLAIIGIFSLFVISAVIPSHEFRGDSRDNDKIILNGLIEEVSIKSKDNYQIKINNQTVLFKGSKDIENVENQVVIIEAKLDIYESRKQIIAQKVIIP